MEGKNLMKNVRNINVTIAKMRILNEIKIWCKK